MTRKSIFIENIKKILKNVTWIDFSGPILILIILSMMILPLSAFFLDIFFTFNIAISVTILLVTMLIKKTLEFSAFPIILLFATLLRLSLNVASTRIILLQGHNGIFSAGRVVEAFGHFLVGSNFTIGIIIFSIFIIINFIVVTKGSGRIAEVSARFILDGMPGKQMAIDADLNSGLIKEKIAKKRRLEVIREADFYGSMDGASKFIRGDAIAGLLIMIINILGGFIVGIVQHGMYFAKAIKTYTLLTIGDGLVAQIPALILSIASGVMVTKVNISQNVSKQMINQLFINPKVFLLSGLVLGILGLVPGMPNLIFLIFTASFLFFSKYIFDKQKKEDNHSHIKVKDKKTVEATWNDVNIQDLISVEVGKNLLTLVDSKEENLLEKITEVRKMCAKKFGFLPSYVHIKSNLDLPVNTYKIFIKGIKIDEWIIVQKKYLAIDMKKNILKIKGESTIEPSFGFSAFWIDKNMIRTAKAYGYSVVQPSSIIATHLSIIISKNLSTLLGFQETQNLLDRVAQEIPKLIENLIPDSISFINLHTILKNLLSENISIKDMRTILETIIEYSKIHKNVNDLTSEIRISLSNSIIQDAFSDLNNAKIMKLDRKIEKDLIFFLKNKNLKNVDPIFILKLIEATKRSIEKQKKIKGSLVLVVHDSLRRFISIILRKHFSDLTILSNLEIREFVNIVMINFICIE
ncbi:flagellar biosynthesis protein FlhA [Buchnera aphidicola (Mindarus keteleerifoliae)]|uniref:flagellar biosynthesis protein FlhA n=1 Tax=Buchnera aphidicola TaxID=9 RepID=UPI0031B71A8B